MAQTTPGFVVRQEGTSVSLPFEGMRWDRPLPPVVYTSFHDFQVVIRDFEQKGFSPLVL
jgi:hypothetical protein